MTSQTEADFNRFKFISIFCGLVVFVLGFFDFWSNKYYRPWKIDRLLNSNPFSKFYNKGFKRTGKSIEGKYRGYVINMTIMWEDYQKKPVYFFNILFDPKSYDRFLRQDECKTMNDSLTIGNAYFTLNCMALNYDRSKWCLDISFEKIMRDIDYSIDFLKARKLIQIDISDWEKLISDLEIYYDNNFVD